MHEPPGVCLALLQIRFNSLFEMPHVSKHDRKSQNLRRCFNSLFEMLRSLRRRRFRDREGFNSLFEMRRRGAEFHPLALGFVFQFSI